MAAQKLTKGRFVQIIIMLTLLIVAFLWRTITYQDVITVNCGAQKQCNFKVNETQFTAKIESEMLSISASDSDWSIKGADIIQEEPKIWQIGLEESKQLSLINNSQEKTYTLELSTK
ncbi:hypothetical protein [Vibrio fluminensis]|uniref:hypothetical protein n=1 Tax=Vibrio fluminensis TaxID=2783614 RepID=UPI001888AE6E|nr:hypothetical protein [Vibrio fluminensis]